MSLSSNVKIERKNYPWGRAYIVEGVENTPLILFTNKIFIIFFIFNSIYNSMPIYL